MISLFSFLPILLPFELTGISVGVHLGEAVGGPDSMTYTTTGHSFYSERPMMDAGFSFMMDFNALAFELKKDTYYLYVSEYVEKTSTETGQTVAYQGITLNAHYPLLDWKGFHVSALAGPEFIYGGENMGINLPFVGDFLKRDSPEKNNMWAFNLGSEVQSPSAFNRLAVFLNAGFSYHFGFSNREIHNYYTEHPLIFSINGGIRWYLYFKPQ